MKKHQQAQHRLHAPPPHRGGDLGGAGAVLAGRDLLPRPPQHGHRLRGRHPAHRAVPRADRDRRACATCWRAPAWARSRSSATASEERNEILIRTPLVAEQRGGQPRRRGGGARASATARATAGPTSTRSAPRPSPTCSIARRSGPSARVRRGRRPRALPRDRRARHGARGATAACSPARGAGLGLEGLSAEAQAVLRDRTTLGAFSVVSAENVGPADRRGAAHAAACSRWCSRCSA